MTRTIEYTPNLRNAVAADLLERGVKKFTGIGKVVDAFNIVGRFKRAGRNIAMTKLLEREASEGEFNQDAFLDNSIDRAAAKVLVEKLTPSDINGIFNPEQAKWILSRRQLAHEDGDVSHLERFRIATGRELRAFPLVGAYIREGRKSHNFN